MRYWTGGGCRKSEVSTAKQVETGPIVNKADREDRLNKETRQKFVENGQLIAKP
jgi:hypothetical protein